MAAPFIPRETMHLGMVQVIVEHKVRNFDEWLPLFREHDKVRRAYGCQGATVRRGADDPQDVVIEFEWSRPERFREFVEKSDLRDVMQRAGVVGEPHIHVLGEPVPWRE